ncbi:serine/threonine protein kinase [Nostocaceae cyanobacterium CENA357]|uniref:Serine/threonine protein kinase n=1 Tax=Atlanticothrix silvestris CENA357 TaxID=1725252 RepID=A0A8J7HHF5_9CYAN|nr:serine/threonine-protein kinase [Atlanticothrix silvestris]MBH8553140.1 serine/threonine protein kinase [Atlanticothrix silvestris CENA357]
MCNLVDNSDRKILLIQERYRLLKQIGKGGFCKTFLAVDESQFPPIPCIVQQFSPRNEILKLFEQKAQCLKELGKHPQIPALVAHFQDDEYFYLVQEFIEGLNLAQIVEQEGAFNESQIWQFLVHILPVIKFISDRNIIHRDIKPENIIRRASVKNREESLVLVDFGAAKVFTEIDRLIGEHSIGNAEYAAPEQAKGKAVFASDLYSLGVTCIYLLTQIAPFDLFYVANDCWVWRQYLTTKVSNRLAQILDRLLQNSVSQRFQSADEVMKAMGIESKIQSFTGLTQSNGKTNRQGRREHEVKRVLESYCVSPSFKLIPSPLWQCLHTLAGNSVALGSVNALSISPDGKTLASGDDKIIRLWDLNIKKLLASLSAHSQNVTSVAFSPDGKILATASDDKTIKLWDFNTFHEIATLCGHSHAVKSVAFSPDGQILASGSWDKKVILWDVSTNTEITNLTGHQLQVSSVAFSPQGKFLATASFDRTIRLWQLRATQGSEGKFQNRPCCTLLGSLLGHTRAVLTIAFSPDGKILATGSDDNTIKLWEVSTGQLITTLLGHSWSVVAIAFTANSETVISASWDKTVKLWRVSTAEELATLFGHVDSVSAVAVSQVAPLIASGSRDKTIKLWQLVEQQES